jgi:uncharacterized protein with GYD domain
MATYILLSKFTEQGVKHVKESPARVAALREEWRGLGVEIKSFYLLMGRYDTLIVAEAPDSATFARAVLALGAQGNVRTETLRAFPEEEYRQILGSIH